MPTQPLRPTPLGKAYRSDSWFVQAEGRTSSSAPLPTPPKQRRSIPAPFAKSPVISALKRELREIRAVCRANQESGQESQRQCNALVERFWDTTAHIAPLITNDPKSKWHAIVTFLWRDSSAHSVLLFINRITDEKNLTESLMKRIPGTDVWHLAYRMETDWRASYCFLPCYNREKLADITGIEQTSIRKALDSGMTDPRNSRQCRNRTGNSLSVVELADAPTQPWLGIMPHVTKRGNVTSHQLADGHVVWVYEPPFEDAAQRRDVPALIMFDGDMWTSGELFPETLNNLIFEGKIPPLYALLVESSDLSSRWEELCEDAGIERFLINRLLSWARTQYPITKDASRLILAGQSLGGLAALWTVMKRPDYIQNIIAQSSSLWRGSLMKRLGDSKTSPLRGFTGRIYLEVGRQEWVLLPLHRELAKVFKKQGLEHRYVEYNGGHDYVCWRGGIADGLCWITQGWIKTSEG